MKFTISGVTSSAAQMRSPSFSRSSSSATMTNLPARMSFTACSTVAKEDIGIGLSIGGHRSVRPHQALHIFANHVGLDVNVVSLAQRVERRMTQGVLDERKLNDLRARQIIDGQADTVDRDGTVAHHKVGEPGWEG